MRRLASCIVLIASVGLGGASCSLVVSTSGLAGGERPSTDAAADAPSGADAGPDGASADAGPVDPDLIAYWSFDDGSGTVVKDRTGNGNDLALWGSAAFDPNGEVGGALRLGASGFAGSSKLSGAAFPASGTISIWFRYTFAANDPDNRGIFDDWDNSRAHLFLRRFNGAAPSEFQTAIDPGVSGSAYAFFVNFQVPRDTWTHVVMTWDASSARAATYLGGTLVRAGAYSAPVVPKDQEVRFGSNFEGLVDEVRLWKRALTAAEVGAIP